jgi:hypothetical protein
MSVRPAASFGVSRALFIWKKRHEKNGLAFTGENEAVQPASGPVAKTPRIRFRTPPEIVSLTLRTREERHYGAVRTSLFPAALPRPTCHPRPSSRSFRRHHVGRVSLKKYRPGPKPVDRKSASISPSPSKKFRQTMTRRLVHSSPSIFPISKSPIATSRPDAQGKRQSRTQAQNRFRGVLPRTVAQEQKGSLSEGSRAIHVDERVAGFFPLPHFAIQRGLFQRAVRHLVELFGVGPLVALDRAIQLRGAAIIARFRERLLINTLGTLQRDCYSSTCFLWRESTR